MPQAAEATRLRDGQSRAPEYGTSAPRTEAPIVETATEARQAVTGHNVRYVLLFGTLGIAVVFAIIYAVFLA
jgi:hypothetical protein